MEGTSEGSTSSVTVTEEAYSPATQQRLLLKLKKPKNDKKVQWDSKTVDNEHMDKKKSKCCCIYSKPKIFGDSSSSSDSDSDGGCPHNAYCTGHKKKCSHKHHHHHVEDHGEDHGSQGPNDHQNQPSH